MHKLPPLLVRSVLALVAASVPALAQTPRSEMRLDSPGGPLAGFPMHNQGQIGSCDAEAAVVLIDTELSRRGIRSSKQSSLAPLFYHAKLAAVAGAKDVTDISTEQLLLHPEHNKFCTRDELAEALKSIAPPESEMCLQALATYRVLIRPGEDD